MLVIRAKAVALAAGLMIVLAAQAFAWGGDGHRMVCRIAYQLLDAPRQAEIRRLTTTFRTPDGVAFMFFTDGCIFPDEARAKAVDNVPGWEKYAPFGSWHFLNVPRTTALIDPNDCAGDCVLTAIAHHTEALANAADDQARAEALFFLGHWLGDIHQPLHISYSDDRGGNDIKPISGGFYAPYSLHSVWDSGIIGKTVATEGWRIHADQLAAKITPPEQASWVRADALEWAQESYNLTTRPATRYCAWRDVDDVPTCVGIDGGRILELSYQDELADDVDLRLQQAGARLADLIRRHLAVP